MAHYLKGLKTAGNVSKGGLKTRVHKIRADRTKNILYILLRNPEDIDMPDFVAEIEEACFDLRPGFSCILVFSEGGLFNPKARWTLYYTENLLYAYGLGRIVHVTEQENGSIPLIGEEIDLPSEFQMENVGTIEEAVEMLTPR